MEAAFQLHQAVCVPAAAAAAADADAAQHSEQQQQQQQQGEHQHAGRRSKQQQQQHKWPCLADLAAGIQQRELATLRAIRSCIRCAAGAATAVGARIGALLTQLEVTVFDMVLAGVLDFLLWLI
jgi:hypothetical protein